MGMYYRFPRNGGGESEVPRATASQRQPMIITTAETRLPTYATALSAIFVRRVCIHLSKNPAVMGCQIQKIQKDEATRIELSSCLFRVLLWLA
jgi:hypothetical protein